MHSSSFQKMAQVLISYCLEIQPGDILRIRAGMVALPLLYEVYRAALRAGAYILPLFRDSTLDEILLREGSTEQILYVSPGLQPEMEAITKWLDILCDTNTRQFTSIASERLALKQQAVQPMFRLFDQREAAGFLRWCITIYPTEAYAQAASMSLMEYSDFLFASCMLDKDDPAAAWQAQDREQQRVVDFLTNSQHIRVVAPGTELEYRCAGRSWINCAGRRNLPDGEVYTSPIEDSVQGHITFSFPSIYNNTMVEGVALTFVEGKVVQATARQGQEFLNGMLDMDAGARYVGEAAFGLNYSIQRATGHAIFDEKIGGTMHLALGLSYAKAGGKNQSMLHWDLVCDLSEGEVYADGQLCYKHGHFIV